MLTQESTLSAPQLSARVLSALVAALAVAVMLNLLSQAIWPRSGWPQIGEVLLSCLLPALAAWPLARALRCAPLPVYALLWALLHLVMIGLTSMLWLGVMAWLCACLGRRLLPDLPALVRLLVGLILVLAVLSWLLWLPVHQRETYLALLLIGAYLLRGQFSAQWQELREKCTQLAAILAQPAKGGGPPTPIASLSPASLSPASPLAALTAWLAVGIVGYSLSTLWWPTMMADDVAYHLRLPSQLAQLGYYRFDVEQQAWALAPWISDVWQSVLWILTGADARGAANLLWQLLILSCLWTLFGTLQAGLQVRWLGILLWVSQPLWWLLGLSMQTELPSMAAYLALVLVWQSAPPVRQRDFSYGVLLGFLAALKVSNVVLAAPLMLWWAWRRELGWASWFRVVSIAAAIGGSSYLAAWLLLGNPFFPLATEVFASALPFEFLPNFPTGLNLAAVWHGQFETNRYLEASGPSGGFQWLILLPWLWPALRAQQTRAWLIAALLSALMIFSMMNYWRYLMPSFALLSVCLALGLQCAWQARPQFTAGIVLLVACLNLVYARNVVHFLWPGSVVPVLSDGRAGLLQAAIPEAGWSKQLLAEGAREGSVLLYDNQRAPGAWLSGAERMRSLHDQHTAFGIQRALDAGTAQALQDWLLESGIEHVWFASHKIDATMQAVLDAWPGATLYRQSGHFQWWRLPSPELRGRVSSAHPLRVPMSQPYVDVELFAATPCTKGELVAVELQWLNAADQVSERKPDWTVCSDSGKAMHRIRGSNRFPAAQVGIFLETPSGESPVTEYTLRLRPNPGYQNDRTRRLWRRLGFHVAPAG